MNFKNLIAWQKAYDLSLKTSRAIRQFPRKERFRLGIQQSRAAISVPANIAEGYER